MKARFYWIASAALVAWSGSTSWGMDAQRGAEVLGQQNCLQCHNVRGVGNRTAPDLSRTDIDDFTPVGLASSLWNHMPRMRAAMTPGIVRPQLSEQDAEDLFAYLYSIAFFDRPGDARRGEEKFQSKGCGGCHAAATTERMANGFALVQQLWNHAGAMIQARATQWPRLNASDIADLAAYLSEDALTAPVTLPDSEGGRQLFEASCGGCHPAIVPLDRRLRNKSLGDIAAGIWNHLPSMQRIPLVAPNELNAIVAYVWEQSLERRGDAGKGRRKFEEKRCASCHSDFVRGETIVTPFTIVSGAWKHDPLSATYSGMRWPALSDEDVADIVAYLNTRP